MSRKEKISWNICKGHADSTLNLDVCLLFMVSLSLPLFLSGSVSDAGLHYVQLRG